MGRRLLLDSLVFVCWYSFLTAVGWISFGWSVVDWLVGWFPVWVGLGWGSGRNTFQELAEYLGEPRASAAPEVLISKTEYMSTHFKKPSPRVRNERFESKPCDSRVPSPQVTKFWISHSGLKFGHCKDQLQG